MKRDFHPKFFRGASFRDGYIAMPIKYGGAWLDDRRMCWNGQSAVEFIASARAPEVDAQLGEVFEENSAELVDTVDVAPLDTTPATQSAAITETSEAAPQIDEALAACRALVKSQRDDYDTAEAELFRNDTVFQACAARVRVEARHAERCARDVIEHVRNAKRAHGQVSDRIDSASRRSMRQKHTGVQVGSAGVGGVETDESDMTTQKIGSHAFVRLNAR